MSNEDTVEFDTPRMVRTARVNGLDIRAMTDIELHYVFALIQEEFRARGHRNPIVGYVGPEPGLFRKLWRWITLED